MEILITINNQTVLTLVDIGATKSCAKADAEFLSSVQINPDPTLIMAANNKFLDNLGKCDLIGVINQQSVKIKPLVIRDLSYDLILGMDFIKSLDFNQNSHFAVLNGIKVDRYLPDKQNHYGKFLNNVLIPPTLDFQIKVKNPIFHLKCDHVEVEAIGFQLETKPDFVINNSIHDNDQELVLSISNMTSRNICLRKNKPYFNVKPILSKINQCNGIKVLNNDPAENEECKRFQSTRKRKFFGNNFVPEFGEIGNGLNANQKIDLDNLLRYHRMSFAAGPQDLGKLHQFKFTMPLKDKNSTSYESARPVPYGIQPKVDKQIQSWLDQEIIEVSSSRHNIPLLIIKKNDGSIRTSLDARKLNNQLVPDRFPLPNLREVIHQLGRRIKSGSECFITQLDLSRGYWQMVIDKPDQSKLAFSYKNKQYVSKRCLYGVSTIPAAFCRMVNEIFGDVEDAFIYLDDIAIVSTSWEDHLKALNKVFSLAYKYGLNLSGKKSRFGCSSMDFLGFNIDKNGVKSSRKHIDKIKDYPTPTTRAELRRFLGICAFTSKMVKNSTLILSPLHQLNSPKRYANFIWEDKHQKAFDEYKNQLSTSTGLVHRDEKLPLVLCSDASLEKFGSVLYQKNGESLEPLSYHSGLFSNAERRLSSRHRELLGITYSIRNFEYELVGNKFTVVTDHQSLVQLMNAKSKNELSNKLVNCLIYLFQFDFDVVHKPGKSDIMAVSDALSRTPITKIDIEQLSDQIDIPDKIYLIDCYPNAINNVNEPKRYYLRSQRQLLNEHVTTPNLSDDQSDNQINHEKDTSNSKCFLRVGNRYLTKEEFSELQTKDNKIQNVMQKLKAKAKSTSRKFMLDDDVLYNINHEKKRPVLPSPLDEEILDYTHIAFGHCGQNKLIQILKSDLYIFDIVNLTKFTVGSCLACACAKPRPPTPTNFTKPKRFSTEPFSTTHWDLWDAGDKDRRGKRYALAVTCDLTKFTDMIPISSKSEETVSKAMIELILRYGMFNTTIITDNGKEFSSIWTEVCKLLSNFHVTTSPFNSKGNSNIERKFRDLNSLLRVHGVKTSTWSESIPRILFYLNNTPKTVLGGLTPFECIYGRSINLVYNPQSNLEDEKYDFQVHLKKWLRQTHTELMRLNLTRFDNIIKQQKMAKHDLVGQKCVIFQPDIKGSKLSVKYDGPYTIIAPSGENSYLVENVSDGRRFRRHIKHIRLLLEKETIKINFIQTTNKNQTDHAGEPASVESWPFADL